MSIVTRTTCGRCRSGTESGQVIVFFALLIPVLFAIGAVVLDVGNWYVHKRHLQTQVDAAALASGPQFVGCFHDPAAANLAIASRALAYAGDTLRPGQYGPSAPLSTTNKQFQQPNDVRVVLNANRYWDKPDGLVPGTNGYGLDNTLDSGDADLLGDPCNERYLDAKATDDDAPSIWGLIPITPSPKTHAKVEIRDLESARGMLPWAVPEIDPAAVVALFVNENSGALVRPPQLLIKADDPALPWLEWVTPVGQEDITLGVANADTGVIILISKNDTDPTNGVPNTIAGYCGQDPGLVACYANPPSQTSGLSFIHSYNGGGGGDLQNPIVRGVELVAVGCSAADLSAPYFTLDGDCTATISAVVDFGVSGATDPGLWPNCVTVNASPGGTMSWGGNVVGGSLFTATMNLPADTGRSQTVLDLNWDSEDQPGGPNNCTNTRWSGTFDKVAAPYVADAASGPVEYLDLTAFKADGLTLMPDANSVEQNDAGNPNYKYFVTVGLPKPHSVTNYADPPLVLRFGSTSGSQSQTYDCDRGVNQTDEIRVGCQTVYTENYVDPDGSGGPQPAQWNNFLCNGWNTSNLPPPTFGPGPSPYPSDCVMTQTGTVAAQRAGLHERFELPTCSVNNWPDNAAEAAVFFGPNGGGYGKDKRYVTLIITDDTAFITPGNDPLPIKYFAGFYVTGWDYHPTQSPGCPDPDGVGPLKGNDDHPLYGCGPCGDYVHSQDDGDVWGYFVDIVTFSGQGTPSDDLCNFGSDPAACIAVLVE